MGKTAKEYEDEINRLRRLVTSLGGDPDAGSAAEGERIVGDLSINQMRALIQIPPNEFWMGAIEGDDLAFDVEKPRRKVSLTRKFEIGQFLVTQALWESVMGNNPSYFSGGRRPVESVSWFDCIQFCNRLSEREGLRAAYSGEGNSITCDFDADGYRLPTESEWECAARAGEYHLYSGSNDVESVAWIDDNSNGETQDVGRKQSNKFKLFDMSGNVDEWCWDRWQADCTDQVVDPTGHPTSRGRVFRGGCFFYVARNSRASNRFKLDPTDAHYFLGFRVARTLK